MSVSVSVSVCVSLSWSVCFGLCLSVSGELCLSSKVASEWDPMRKCKRGLKSISNFTVICFSIKNSKVNELRFTKQKDVFMLTY